MSAPRPALSLVATGPSPPKRAPGGLAFAPEIFGVKRQTCAVGDRFAEAANLAMAAVWFDRVAHGRAIGHARGDVASDPGIMPRSISSTLNSARRSRARLPVC